MRERAVRFGKGATLAGVLTEPVPGAVEDARPAVVFLNSGILHHVGASRLYVRLARRLAEVGFLGLRFDFSGIGDSEPRRDALSFQESAPIETREALDHLGEMRGAKRFVLAGLCSGSDVAFHAALGDERVAGIINLDAWAYRTWRYYARRFAPKLLDPAAWRHSLRVRLARLRSREDVEGPSFVAPEYRREFPPREIVANGLRQLIERDVRLFHFFSGGMEAWLNYEEQYEDAFRGIDFSDHLCVLYRPQADHTLTQLDQQVFVIDRITAWMTEHFGSSAVPKDEAAATAR